MNKELQLQQQKIAEQHSLSEKTVARFSQHLTEKTLPDEHQIRSGTNDSINFLISTLTNKAHLTTLAQREIRDDEAAFAKMELNVWKETYPLPIPTPTFTEQMNGIKLAVMVMLGTLAGGLLLSGAFNFLSDDPKTGQVIGSILGAGATTLLMWYASENKNIRRYLVGILGIATAAEIAILFGKMSGLGTLWGLMRTRIAGIGILAGLRRFFVYFGVVILLRMSVRKPVFDRLTFEKNMQLELQLWIDHATTFLKSLLSQPKSLQTDAEKVDATKQKTLRKLGSFLQKLHNSPADTLPTAVSEMLLAAQNLGFEGINGDPIFISGENTALEKFNWTAEHSKSFNTLGVIEIGDLVFVEEPPIIQDGSILEKGNVRKVRKR